MTMWLCLRKANMQAETIAVFTADDFKPWKLLGDYTLIDRLIKQHPEGFDVRVTRHGTYHFRPTSAPQDPSISSWGIYVAEENVYRITSSLHGVKRRPRKNKASPDLVNEAETTKTNPSTSSDV